jgi:hypothetical protein
MVIRAESAKAALWFAATMMVALSFPLQVTTGSPFPALIPYAFIGLGLMITAFFAAAGRSRTEPNDHPNIRSLVRFYVALVLLNTGWQAAFNAISPAEAGGAFVVYLLPVIFYSYFRRTASERELRAVLWAIVAASAVVGLYFAYDSYLKLALGQVSEYSKLAFQYSLDRANQTAADASDARIRAGWRSFGLLESHSVSGFWVALGGFASLALVGHASRVLRRAVVLVFGAMILLGLNFTAIVAFVSIVVLFEFGGLSMLRGRVSARLVGNVMALGAIGALLIGGAFAIVGPTMSQFIIESLSGQTDLALGTGGGKSMLGLAVANGNLYLAHLAAVPTTLLIGDGFSSFGVQKGGDIGLIDTLARFGIPLFVATLLGYAILIRDGVRQIVARSRARSPLVAGMERADLIQFAVCVTLLMIISDGHYSVWGSKAVLPVVFFSLALFDRFLGESAEEGALAVHPVRPGAKAAAAAVR